MAAAPTAATTNSLNPEDEKTKPQQKVSFSRLKKITNDTLHSDAIKIAWKAVKDIVALQIMGDRGCAVPYLQEATKYGLLNVLVKERRPVIDKLTRKPSVIHWSAPLEAILPDYISTDEFRASHHLELIEEDYKKFLQYHLHNKDAKKDGSKADKTPCNVEVKLHDIQHYKINSEYQEVPVEVKKYFEGVENIERIYLITEVYVATGVVMNVMVGEMSYQWNKKDMMPIGFIFKKCDMSSGGVLKYGAEVERKKAIAYNWVSVTDEDESPKSTRDTLAKKK